MRFVALDLSLAIIRQLEPIVRALRLHDRKLVAQLQQAATSVSLNLGEGSRRQGRDRKHFWNIASGSNEEVRTALHVAVAWRYLDERKLEAVLADIDTLQRILWKITR